MHRPEDTGEIVTLIGLDLRERRLPRINAVGDDHFTHSVDAVPLEEHVLRSTETDSFRTKSARYLGVVRSVRVCAHADLPELIRPTHQRLEIRAQLRILRFELAGEDLAGRAIQRDVLAFAEHGGRVAIRDREPSTRVIDSEGACARNTRLAHTPRHHSSVRCHATSRGEHCLRGYHSMEILGRGFDAHQDHLFALQRELLGLVRIEDNLACRGTRRGGQTLGQRLDPRLSTRRDHRVQELIELLRLDTLYGGPAVDQSFICQVDRDSDGRGAGALACARLEHVQRAALDCELHVLDIFVVTLQSMRDLGELLVDLRHVALHLRDRTRRADAGHDVLALRVDQVLTIQRRLAGGWVAREGDAGGGVIAHIAEDHRLDVDSGAEVVRNPVQAAIVDCAPTVPGAEYRGDRLAQLLLWILGKLDTLGLPDNRLEPFGDLGQLLGRQIGILPATLALRLIHDVLELLALDAEHDLAEELDEAAVGIGREARIVGQPGQPLARLLVQAQVEHRVHHAGHGELRAGAYR